MKLHRPARRALLVVHVAASVSWLGLSLGLLALGVTAFTTAAPEAAEASYRSMKMFADWLIIPIALTTLGTGLLLSLGTSWGLARHRWVYTKFWMTLAATGLSVFALRPGINHATAQVIAGQQVADAGDLIIPPSVSLSAYLFMTAISVLKPWGLTKRGRRPRSRARRPVDAKTVRVSAWAHVSTQSLARLPIRHLPSPDDLPTRPVLISPKIVTGSREEHMRRLLLTTGTGSRRPGPTRRPMSSDR